MRSGLDLSLLRAHFPEKHPFSDSLLVNRNMLCPEWWLLETALVARVLLHHCLPSNQCLVSQWGRPSHGLQDPEIAQVIENVYHKGWIEFTENDVKIFPDGKISDWVLSVASNSRADFTYHLTLQGGNAWESKARPDWSCFHTLDREYTLDREEKDIVIARAETENHAAGALSLLHELKQTPLLSTMKKNPVAPWQATYWKTLRTGFEISCQVEEAPFKPAEKFDKQQQEFHDRCLNFCQFADGSYEFVYGW